MGWGMMNSLRYDRLDEIEIELKEAKTEDDVNRLNDEKRKLEEAIAFSNLLATFTKGG